MRRSGQLAQIFARCPALLQFLHYTSHETLQSFWVCTVLHFPLKNASSFSFLGEGLFWCWFVAWLRFVAWLGFFVTFNALSPFCSSQRSERSQPWASFLMNCQLTPMPWRRSFFQNCGDRQPKMKIMAMISCCVMSFGSHSSARSRILLKYCTMDSPHSWGA